MVYMSRKIYPIGKRNLFQWALVFIVVLLIVGLYLTANSVSFRRVTLFTKPQPLPLLIDSVWPAPGSTIPYSDFSEPNQLRRIPGICIRLSQNEKLGITSQDLLPEVTTLMINGVPALHYHSEGVMLVLPGDPEWPETCWSVPLQPGQYLVELNIEGSSIVNYDWAFQITQE